MPSKRKRSPASLSTLGVYFPCPTRTEVVHKEGLDPASWKTVRTELSYDGYGNVTLEAKHGVVDVTGDELYTETEYVTPSSRWLIGLPSRERVYDAPGNHDFAETLTYYDGEAFVGLPLGQATEGFVSRVTRKVDLAGALVNETRARRDQHGNSVETIDPNGSIADATQHRRSYVYDETGFFLVITDLHNAGDDGQPNLLRRESRYERNFQKVAEVTKWMLVENGAVVSNRDSRSYRYDDFGRIIAELRPGDDLDKPTFEYAYELGPRVSRLRVLSRSTNTTTPDEESFFCIDGKGRTYQERRRVAAGEYQVTGFRAFNARGKVTEVWQPSTSSMGTCDFTVPSSILRIDSRYDGLGRLVQVTRPGTRIYGENITSRTVYLPLATESYDEEDDDPSSPHAGTPGGHYPGSSRPDDRHRADASSGRTARAVRSSALLRQHRYLLRLHGRRGPPARARHRPDGSHDSGSKPQPRLHQLRP